MIAISFFRTGRNFVPKIQQSRKSRWPSHDETSPPIDDLVTHCAVFSLTRFHTQFNDGAVEPSH